MSEGAESRWWTELRSSALIGTGRRAVPTVAELDGFGRRPGPSDDVVDAPIMPDPLGDLVPSTVALLDAAAMGAMALRAGRRARPARVEPFETAPPDGGRAEAPPTATQLLELLLGPAPPAGVHRNALISHWCRSCSASGARVPDRLLVTVLDHATAMSAIRPAVVGALAPRGRWLADQNEAWSWAATTGVDGLDRDGAPATDVDPDEWALLGSSPRIEVLTRVRRLDPDRGRDLLLGTWATDSAAARAAHLAVLVDGLGPADEALLEVALDDRSKVVRQRAAVLLDGLADSARALRMAARLRPLLSIEGRRRHRSIEVALPGDPDPAAIRDGLTPPPSGRSARAFWLEQMTAGAPLDLWTDLTGDDPAATVELIGDPDVQAGLLRAVLARRDPRWAAELHRIRPDPRLLDLMPPDERVEVISRALGAKVPPAGVRLTALVDHLPAPWSPRLSTLVLAALRADGSAATTIQQSTPVLATALDASAQAAIESWLRGLEDQPHLAAALRTLIQYQSLHRSITEAFS